MRRPTPPAGEGRSSRRRFIRMGVVGTAMASAALMDRDRAAGRRDAGRSLHIDGQPRGGVGLVQAGPELALPPGFSYQTFGAFGSAMSDGFITPPIHDGMAVFDSGGGRSASSATTSWARATTSRPAR